MTATFQLEGSGERQATSSHFAPARVPQVADDVLRSPGKPLDPETRAFMEPRFGYDFSKVRVHTGARAVESAQAVNALAYTVGYDVVFGAHAYAPATKSGQRLIAHELTHVVQQQRCSRFASKSFGVSTPFDPAEREAETVARSIEGPQTPMITRAGAGVQRDVGWAQRGRDPYGTAESPWVEPAAPATRTFALTFDDGPHAAELGKGINFTEKVLDILKAKGIKAGFFVQTGVSYRGASAVGRSLVARMSSEGHKVGIHTGGTTDHELHTKAQQAGRLEGELESAKKYILTETKQTPTLVRPPTGVSDKDVLATYQKLGLTNLLWDMDGDQGKNLPLATLKARVKSEMLTVQARGWKPSTPSPNIVVLYHDIQRNTAENLDVLIEHIKTTTQDISGKKDTAAFAAP